MNRRTFISHGCAALLLAVSMLTIGNQASGAEVDWCADDPVFTVNGATYHVTAYWDKRYVARVTGVAYVVSVPQNATVSYSIPSNETTNVKVRWTYGDRGAGIAVRATVNATGHDFATKVVYEKAGPDKTVYGTTNDPMTIRLTPGTSGNNRGNDD